MDSSDRMQDKIRYTCNQYREEMILASLRQRLGNANLVQDEKQALIREIEKIEKEMGF